MGEKIYDKVFIKQIVGERTTATSERKKLSVKVWVRSPMSSN